MTRRHAARLAATAATLTAMTIATTTALIPLPALAAARPATPTDPVPALQALGLDVVDNDGFIGASGAAPLIQAAASLFSQVGDYALFTGPNETGTGYLAITDDNTHYWVELQVPASTVGSIINDTTDDVGFFTVANHEGTRQDEEGPETTGNTPNPDAPRARPDDSGAKGVAAGSPGVVSGNVIQIPLHVPINLCGNSIDIIALLNAASGNTCVNG